MRNVQDIEDSWEPSEWLNKLFQTGVFILPNGKITLPNAAFDHSKGDFALPIVMGGR
jgi:hypothetical protein